MEKKVISILLILVILSMSLSSLILPIYASEILTINVETDKDSYNIGDTVTATVKWNKDMQAADFEVGFDAGKLRFNTCSIGEDYYNLYENGKVLVSWADENETNLQEISFTFTALALGETEINITPRGFDTGNFDTEYTYQVVNKTINIIDPNQETEEPETGVTTLEQYLIANGVDSNGDKALSDAEWATVKNLNLNGEIDITGIEKAVNLKSLEMSGINPSTIDFSKLTNLKSLYIAMYGLPLDTKIDLDFPNMNKLKKFSVNAWLGYSSAEGKSYYGINSLDISKLLNLTYINLDNTYNSEIKFPTLEKIQNMDVDVKNDTVINLVNSTELSNCLISTDIEITSENLENRSDIVLPNLKYGEKYVSFIKWQGTENYTYEVELEKIEDSKFTFKLGTYFTYFGYEDYNPGNTELITDGILSKVGTETIKVTDDFGNVRDIKITVHNNVEDTTLEDTGITAKFINSDTILKSNGELWKVNSVTSAEKIDTNVKDYVSDLVYTNDMSNGFFIANTLKNDNTLVVKYNDVEKEISNVTSMTPSMYVTTAGELYELNINYITEEMKPTKILEDAKIVYGYSTKYIVMNDGTSYRVLEGWRNYTANNDYEEYLILPKTDRVV